MAGKAKTKPKASTKTTKTSKSKKKTPVKKKAVKKQTIDIFADSLEVSKQQAQLKALEEDRKSIEQNIKDIIDTYNSKTANNRDAERFLDKLPLDSLKELQDFLNGKKKESNLDILKLRAQLRKDRNKQVDQLIKIEEEISKSQIDLLLAKINHVIGKIGDTKKD